MDNVQIVMTAVVSVASLLILVIVIIEIQRHMRSAQALGAPKGNPSQQQDP